MKLRRAALLAAVGVIITVIPVILNFFSPSGRTFLMGYSIKAIGSVFIVFFFYSFLIGRQEDGTFRVPGVLGLVGYLVSIALHILNLINDSIFYGVVNYSAGDMGLLNVVLVLRRAEFLARLIPVVLLLICFIIAYRNLEGKSYLKKPTLVALIGQFITLAYCIIVFIFNMPFMKMLRIESFTVINIIEPAIELTASMFLVYFFIVFYKESNSIKNRLQYVIGS